MNIPINKINEFIEQHLKEEFTLTDIADAVGYSVYHLSREHKSMTGQSIMDYVRERKIFEAAKDIKDGKSVLETALNYGFETHSGFTRAFSEIIGCSPQDYYQHTVKMEQKGEYEMDQSKLKIRLVCQDDMNDLWENVYSAMTPRQIMEDKIMPSINNYKNRTGFLAVAELDKTVVMTMWVERLYSGPGFVYDSHYVWQDDEYDYIFLELLEGTKRYAKQLNMTALCLYEENADFAIGFVKGGFKKVFSAGEFEYYMLDMYLSMH